MRRLAAHFIVTRCAAHSFPKRRHFEEKWRARYSTTALKSAGILIPLHLQT